jgi:hypothetical protein
MAATTTASTAEIRRALEQGQRIDITTRGRKTGQPRRIEIVFHNIEGRIFISGRPGHPRGWIANLGADPHFTFHLKGPVFADLPHERRTVLRPIARSWGAVLEPMVATSPLIEVTFPPEVL